MAGAGSGHDVLLSGGVGAAGELPQARVVVAAVPWARHDSSFTRAFEDQVAWLAAWLAVHTNKTAVAELIRIAACLSRPAAADTSRPVSWSITIG